MTGRGSGSPSTLADRWRTCRSISENRRPSLAPPPADIVPDGAAPFSFLDIPEPLAAADVDFSGVITKANFLKLADRRFDKLDPDQLGYLTLAKLPKTYVQKKLEHANRKGIHFLAREGRSA